MTRTRERKVLVLGGTLEASRLAATLAERGERAVLSYAGRVAAPRAQPVPVRMGGFGGAAGLACYLRAEAVTHLVDATHPFAAAMSRNAVEAAVKAGVPLVALTRPPWRPGPEDNWINVPDAAGAIAALGAEPRRVFLAVGRQGIGAFAAAPQHQYLLRLVDLPAEAPPLPRASVVVARGPFDAAGDLALLRAHRIEAVVAKNAGGEGAAAKLVAARALRLQVVMIARPASLLRREVTSVAEVLDWLGHASADLGV